MSMNSERHRVQTYIEDVIGCPSPDQLSAYKQSFEEFTIRHSSKIDIDLNLSYDLDAYLSKGLASILHALEGLDNKRETWSLIKFYYSIYFFMRARLCADGVAFLRCGSIYTLRSRVGNSPEKRNGPNYRGDHKATASVYAFELDQRDYFLSQTINEESVFRWYSGQRDWINYKKRDFIDQIGMKGLSSENNTYEEQVDFYCRNDRSVFVFDPDHALIALPLAFCINVISPNLANATSRQALEAVVSQFPKRGSPRILIDKLNI